MVHTYGLCVCVCVCVCVCACVWSGSSEHIPYRDSKLTRILENALSGNAHVAIICAVSPAACNFEETVSTYARFACFLFAFVLCASH
jgi:hypothetical protein